MPCSPICRSRWSIGSGNKVSFEQIGFLTVSPRQFRQLADRLFQTVAEECLKDRSAKVEWALFTTSRFGIRDAWMECTAEQTDTGRMVCETSAG